MHSNDWRVIALTVCKTTLERAISTNIVLTICSPLNPIRPQVSYASTGTSLSDKTRYDFFARTVPPDTYQALALVDLVQSFNWSYVSLVTSEGQYGDSGMNAFAKEAKKRNICIAMNEKVPQNADQNYFHQILANLKAKPNAKGVVLFLRAEDSRGLLEAAKATNQSNYFTFIASDGWGTQEKLVIGVEEEAEGAITVELQSKEIEEFDYYIGNLTAYHKRNPWFKEYWQDTFECRLPPLVDSDNVDTINQTICSPNLQIDKSMGYRQESKVQFVVDAVYAFAHALHNAWLDLCSGMENYCPALKELDGETFYKKYLLNVSFTGRPVFCLIKSLFFYFCHVIKWTEMVWVERNDVQLGMDVNGCELKSEIIAVQWITD